MGRARRLLPVDIPDWVTAVGEVRWTPGHDFDPDLDPDPAPDLPLPISNRGDARWTGEPDRECLT